QRSGPRVALGPLAARVPGGRAPLGGGPDAGARRSCGGEGRDAGAAPGGRESRMRLRHDGGVSTLPDAEPLITLLALHEAGSESLAAEVLGVGQSAVSRRIASLQRLTREPLTVRTASGTKLTPAGERLLPFARDARAALQGAARWLAGGGAAPPLPLRRGVAPALTPRRAGRLAALGRDGAPLAVDEAWSRELVEAVRRGDVDAAAVLWAPAGAEPGLTTEDLPPDDVAL